MQQKQFLLYIALLIIKRLFRNKNWFHPKLQHRKIEGGASTKNSSDVHTPHSNCLFLTLRNCKERHSLEKQCFASLPHGIFEYLFPSVIFQLMAIFYYMLQLSSYSSFICMLHYDNESQCKCRPWIQINFFFICRAF